MVGRRDALYRIVATTDCKLGLESTGTAGGGGWASRDSLTIITKVGGTREGQARESGTTLQMGTDWPLPFKNGGLGEGDYWKKNRNSKIKKKKNSLPVHNKTASALQGPRLAAGASGRQAWSLQGKISGSAETVSCT